MRALSIIFISSDRSDTAPTVSRKRAEDAQVTSLKAQLKQMLSQPVVARGVSTRYLTSGSRPIVDDLIEGASELYITHVLM